MRLSRLRAVGWALDRPGPCLALAGLLTLLLGSGLLRLELRTDGEAVHPSANRVIDATRADRDTFVERERILVLVTSTPEGPAVESVAGLGHLRDLQRSLESLPSVDRRRPRSLATLLDPNPDLPLVLIQEFLRDVPEAPEEHAALLRRIHAFSLAEGLFLSADGRAAALYVPLAPGASRSTLLADLEAWLDEQRANSPAFDLRLLGPAVAEATLGDTVLRDLARLVPIMVAVMAGLLWLCLGTPAGVLIPMAEVGMVLIWTLGAMGHCGVPVTLVTTILPVVLMTMAVTDEVHLLERFQSENASGTTRRALEAAIDAVGRPIVLTSLTTAAGFAAFLSASMVPLRHFGLFAALGILVAMLLSFTFVPALVRVLPDSWLHEQRRQPRRLLAYERFVVRRPRFCAAIAVVLVACAAPGLLHLSIQDSWVGNFDPASDLASAERDFNARFWGSYRFDVVLTADDRAFFTTPDGLQLVERLREVARAGPHVGGVLTHLLPFEVIARVEGLPEPVSALPRESFDRLRELVRFIEHRIDMTHVLSRHEPSARVQIFVPSSDYVKGRELRDYLDAALPPLLGPAGVAHRYGGDLPVAMEVVRAIVDNQLRSLALALAGAGLLVLLAQRGLAETGKLLAPVAAALPILFGVMGYAGVALGIATSMFAALTIGVGVDFAVHLSHAYRESRGAGSSDTDALSHAFQTTGRALRWNVSVLAIGFLVLVFSDLRPNQSLGLLLSAAILACYATSILLLPSLLSRSCPRPFW
jgi:predicted RND superfamily exporter protein